MKRIFCTAAIALLLSAALPAIATAESFYVGVKTGLMMPDVDGLDDAVNGGLLFGYEFVSNEQVGSIAVEFEYTNTISEGDVSGFGMGGDWEIETMALYGVYRSPGTVYFKGKLGILNEDVTIDFGGFEASESDSGGSVGIGGGFRISDQARMEAEYTIIEEDVSFLSLGLNLHF